MKIYVVGCGYVGLANGVALSKNFKVTLIDNDKNKNKLFVKAKTHSTEKELNDEFQLNFNKFSFEDNVKVIDNNEDSYVLICLPTNFNEQKGAFDTSIIEKVVKDISTNKPHCKIIIKSTIPVGFTEKLIKENSSENIFFSPEFLREGSTLYDIKNPSRIIVSPINKSSDNISKIFSSIAENNPDIMHMNTKEAESVKLFSNSYLAMRVAYFNEIDSFCINEGMDAETIIRGMAKDKRIGEGYNNPSFGYGGYCLPKDTKQIITNINNKKSSLISSIPVSNEERKNFIIADIVRKGFTNIGIYNLAMKKGSDNYRESSIFSIINGLLNKNLNIYIYDDTHKNLEVDILKECRIVYDFKDFVQKSDLIITNRYDHKLKNCKKEIYSRDIFNIY